MHVRAVVGVVAGIICAYVYDVVVAPMGRACAARYIQLSFLLSIVCFETMGACVHVGAVVGVVAGIICLLRWDARVLHPGDVSYLFLFLFLFFFLVLARLRPCIYMCTYLLVLYVCSCRFLCCRARSFHHELTLRCRLPRTLLQSCVCCACMCV